MTPGAARPRGGVRARLTRLLAASVACVGLIAVQAAAAARPQPVSAEAIGVACAAFLDPADSDGATAATAWMRADAGAVPADADRLFSTIRSADIVLLGEVHDNPVHHKLQACLLAVAASGGPAVVFEQITADETAALADYLAKPDATPGGLGAAVGWESRGWPSWSIYEPIAAVALANRLTLHAGDAPKSAVRRIAREGDEAVTEPERRRLGLDRALPDMAQSALLDELVDSHCGVMPKTAFDGMALAQRYRDATLAVAAVEARKASGKAVLIAGNGHVRSDRGVPWYLASIDPAATVVVVTMAEAREPTSGVPTGAPRDPDGRLAADAVIVTRPIERPDPCEEMRSRFGKKSG